MTIPVRNIYYLLLYAWGQFKGGEVRDVGKDDSPDLPTLLANILNDGCNRLLRRGLDRGYMGFTEETRTPRGKLRLDAMAKQQTLLRGRAVCDLDELTVDVLHNQIIKATLTALAKCDNIKKSRRHNLRLTAMRFAGVSPIRLTPGLFGRVQLSRNTAQYGLLLRVCELVFHALFPDDGGRGLRFMSILKDETRMSAVFEEFLRNFYRSELEGFKVGGEHMSWHATANDPAVLELLPIMRTDITLRSADTVIIADAKYNREILSGGQYKAKVRPSHLYQLTTYLRHAQRRYPMANISGLLIYASTGYSMRLAYNIFGVPVNIVTLDLSAEWPDIHTELLALLEPGMAMPPPEVRHIG